MRSPRSAMPCDYVRLLSFLNFLTLRTMQLCFLVLANTLMHLCDLAMHRSLCVFISLITPMLVLSLSQKLSSAVSSLAQDKVISVQNGTSNRLTNNWPSAPFRVYIDASTYIHIIALPLLDLPFNKPTILLSLFEISGQIRNSYNPRTYLPGQTKFTFGDEDVNVDLEFFAPDMRSIRYGYARKIVDELYYLTMDYGVREITWADVEIDGVIVSHMWLHITPNLAA